MHHCLVDVRAVSVGYGCGGHQPRIDTAAPARTVGKERRGNARIHPGDGNGYLQIQTLDERDG